MKPNPIHIAVEYTAQVKRAAGLAAESFCLAAGCDVQQLIVQVAEKYGSPMRVLLLDPQGQLQPTLLLFIGDRQVHPTTTLSDGDCVSILSPISGG